MVAMLTQRTQVIKGQFTDNHVTTFGLRHLEKTVEKVCSHIKNFFIFVWEQSAKLNQVQLSRYPGLPDTCLGHRRCACINLKRCRPYGIQTVWYRWGLRPHWFHSLATATVYISKVNKVVHKYKRFSVDAAAVVGSLVVRPLDY